MATTTSEQVLATLASMLASVRAEQRDLKVREDELCTTIRAVLGEQLGTHEAGEATVTLSANRRFDESRALDALAKAPQDVRTRCVVSQVVQKVDRDALKVLSPEIHDAAWTVGAPVVKVAVRDERPRERGEQS